MNHTHVIWHDGTMPEILGKIRTIRWGILATGKIAATFARDLRLVEDCTLAAVGSRSLEAAQAFATEHGAERAYGSYDDLVADPNIDIIYVATPHGRHLEDVIRCFDADKAVLCEKALTLNASQTRTLIDEARARGLFFAEAMWMRCNPNIRRIQEMVRAGACGTVGQLRAELGFVADPNSARLWDPALAPSAGSQSRAEFGSATNPSSARNWPTVPHAPARTISWIRRMFGLQRIHIASAKNSPRARASSMRVLAVSYTHLRAHETVLD